MKQKPWLPPPPMLVMSGSKEVWAVEEMHLRIVNLGYKATRLAGTIQGLGCSC